MQRLLIAYTPFSSGQEGLEKPTRLVLTQNWNDVDGTSDTYAIHYQTVDGALFSGRYVSCRVLGDTMALNEAYCDFLKRIAEHNSLYREGNVSHIPMGVFVCNPPEVIG